MILRKLRREDCDSLQWVREKRIPGMVLQTITEGRRGKENLKEFLKTGCMEHG